MVVSPLYKKLYRDIYRAKGQFIAVIAVILCGIAAYITVSFAFKNLLLSRDTYCHDYRLADLFFRLDRAPRSVKNKLQAITGVTAVSGRIVFDVTLDLPGNNAALVGRIISMPDKREQVLNDIHMTSGGYFRSGQENGVIVNPAFCEKNQLEIGDALWATINNRKRKLHIVGTALSPEYIYTIRNAQEFIPNPKGFAICYVKESFAENAFGYQEAINDVALAVSSPNLVEIVKGKAETTLEAYGVLSKVKQEDQISYKFISDELMGLEASAKITPAIFLGVAALVIFIMLSRIVVKERIQIGVMMALGYNRWKIMSHYLGYALVTSLSGAVCGAYVGNYLAGGMLEIYGEFYRFPVLKHKIYWDVFGWAIVLSLIYCSIAGLLAVRKIMTISPSTAMRPAPPISGKRILLEQWAVLWTNISFTWKMVLRNLFRHKSRAFFIVIGVALSCAILIQAFFSTDCMDHLIHYEFSATQQQDIKVFFATEKSRAALYELRRVPNVIRVEPIYEYGYDIKRGWRKKTIVITGLNMRSQLRPLFATDHRRIRLPQKGLVLAEKLANILQVRRGDKLIVKPLHRGKKEKIVVVKNIVGQYLGINGYMSIGSVSRVMGENFVINGALLKVQPGTVDKVHKELKKRPAIATMEFKEAIIHNFENAIGASMYVMTGILSIFAGVIAFAIVYNSAIITIGERQRELATLKVMGFTQREISQVVFNEYFVLAFAGIMLGLPLGKFLCAWMVDAYNTDLYRLPLIIYNRTYIKTICGIMVFVFISQWACRRRLKQLDMVEVLKERE